MEYKHRLELEIIDMTSYYFSLDSVSVDIIEALMRNYIEKMKMYIEFDFDEDAAIEFEYLAEQTLNYLYAERKNNKTRSRKNCVS